MPRKKYRCVNCRRIKDMVRFPLRGIAKQDQQGKLLCHVCRQRGKGYVACIAIMEWGPESKKEEENIEYEE